MKVLGAIIGDIVGSRFEWNNIKTKEFELLSKASFVTDDTIMTLAIAKAFVESKEDYSDLGEKAVLYMQELGKKYPNAGYGGLFSKWLCEVDPKPYASYGNGAAMRVSAAGIVAKSLEEAIKLSISVTEVTHNHSEGLKGAEATAVAIYLAKSGKSIEEIRSYINEHYYKLDFSLDEIRATYKFNETCQETVPQALVAFFESTSFEDALRNAVSLGGDSDTLAAIAGSVAASYYDVPMDIIEKVLPYLDETQLLIFRDFIYKFEGK